VGDEQIVPMKGLDKALIKIEGISLWILKICSPLRHGILEDSLKILFPRAYLESYVQ
jgi:hypothetical protein